MSDAVLETFDGHTPVVDPTAWLHRTAVVIGKVTIGRNCSVWPHATLRGDEGTITIGDDTNIQDGTTVHMTGGESDTVVGSRVTVGHNCILHGCIVEDDVLIGMGTTILDNTVIGRGSYIGAGTLITGGKTIPPGSLVFGNPMRIVRPVNDRETGWIDYAWRHYVEGSRKYAKR
jgi:carbonic anhydrase/acetyltransferase-like protein (isoleucine patch superfamily)